MKKSSKQRKLDYIREKNSYRRGAKARYLFKVFESMAQNTPFFDLLLKKEVYGAINILERRFKMKFELSTIEKGLEQHDLITQLITFRLTFKVSR